jgi:hypothetical protein
MKSRMGNQRSMQYAQAVSLAGAMVALVGCDGQGTLNQDDLHVEVRTGALTNKPGEFSKNTPTVMREADVHLMSTLIGNGGSANQIVTYTRATSSNSELPQWQLGLQTAPYPTFTGSSTARPLAWWEDTLGEFTTLFSDSSRSDVIMDPVTGSQVLPLSGFTPLGPPSAAVEMADGTACSFGLYNYIPSGTIIMRSCLQNKPPVPPIWEDWGLELPSVAQPTLTPTTSPMVFRRSLDSDSLSYSCGPSTAQACEFRIGGPSSNETFPIDFSPGSFMTGTRPTAMSNGYQQYAAFTTSIFFTNTNPDRFAFAATVNGSTKSVIAKHETNPVDYAAPIGSLLSYTTSVVETTTDNVTYSTPMPYIRSDCSPNCSTGLVYFRTQAGYTTRVMESFWTGSTWSAPVQIYDAGVVIPSGNEPQAYSDITPHDITGPGRNAIFLRLPLSGGVDDIVMLEKGPDATSGYVNIFLPLVNGLSGLNLVSPMSAFEDSAWTKVNLTVPSGNVNTQTTLAPNTTFTSELLRETTATGTHEISQSVTIADRTVPYRWSVYLKGETRTAAQVVMDSTDDTASSVYVSVDLTAGTITPATLGTASYYGGSIEAMGNNWYRVSVEGKPTTVVGAKTMTGKVRLVSSGSNSYAGSTSKGLYIWGGELSVYGQTVAPSSSSIRINCGNNGAIPPFIADTDFSGGAGKTRTNVIDLTGVVNPAPMAVYQSQHYASPFTYTIPGLAAASSHVVRLHFAETNPLNNAPNKRKFSVAINGTTQISNLDLFATVGLNHAYIKEFSLPANSSGQYVLSFTASIDSATISGIEVL